MLNLFKWSHVGIFAGGILFATKGVELLRSREARDVFVKATALGVKNRDDVMKCVTSIREECEDIYADALELNKKKEEEAAAQAAKEVIEDKSESGNTKK